MKRVLYHHPEAQNVVVRANVPYQASTQDRESLDVYYPPARSADVMMPAVILVSGLSDVGARAFLGCRINEMASFTSWARLIAASGVIAITYTTGLDPAADTRAVLHHLDTHGGALGVDKSRLGVWACSSHVPNALGQLIEHPHSFACAVLCYGFMLDLDGATGVKEAQRTWHFAHPAEGKTIDDLPGDSPLFIVRAGQDAIPHVNESIDRFLGHALNRNLPVTVVNHHQGRHAFDVEEASHATRAIVKQILVFLELRLLHMGRER